ncbi:MAG: 6-pyruvoyl tetrahydropterin synthase family protein [Candidatus Methanofastidiosia archaeon]
MYEIYLRKNLEFSSAHFVVETEKCERLHGHNYKVSVNLWGDVDDIGYLVDFLYLKKVARDICRSLDHKILIAEKNNKLKIKKGDRIEVEFKDKKFVFPRDDCLLLPIKNTSAELLASFLLKKLKEKLLKFKNIRRIKVGVAEDFGQWGFYGERF